MAPRPDVSEERKNQILEAAIAVFARLGFRGARMDDIAEQAGLSKGALYLYYKSKDAIIAALLKYLFAQEFKQLQVLVESDREGLVAEHLMTLTHQFAPTMQWMSRASSAASPRRPRQSRWWPCSRDWRCYFSWTPRRPGGRTRPKRQCGCSPGCNDHPPHE
jgi:AcrR family transcriptional regulator